MADRPNVVWITMESTRADHTTVGGYARDTTPNLARIADGARGRSFDRSLAHGIWTLTSSASILTGTYPGRHRALATSDAVPDALPTVPERLSAAGYATACISPNSHLSSATGLDRGFDRFAWLAPSTFRETVGLRGLLNYARNVRRHGGGLTLESRRHGTDYLATDLAKRWLGSLGDDEPFFLYLHHGDPHHPYVPPRRFREQYAADPEVAAEFSLDVHDNMFEYVADGCPFDDGEWAALRAMYDGQIAHTDELVGHLFDHVRERAPNTVFVVTGDHGELFGEYGLLAHQLVVDEAVAHVPLVVHGLDAATTHDGEMVQPVDLMRTLVDRAGADTDGMQGIDLAGGPREYSVVQRGGERRQTHLDAIREHDPGFELPAAQEGLLTGLWTEEFKLLDGERTELYRLPDERTEVSGAFPEVAADLAAELDEWYETEGQPVAGVGERAGYSDAMREQLSDLGYLVD